MNALARVELKTTILYVIVVAPVGRKDIGVAPGSNPGHGRAL
jgi:hypothetical protein